MGSWTLGASTGTNTLTATSAGLAGSPVTFTATGTAGILQVQYNGTPVRSYSLTELEALTPFAGNFGFRNSIGNVTGPEAVTGVKVTDLVTHALGTPLTASESVAVTATDNYAMTYTYDQLVNLTGFTMWQYGGTSWDPVDISSLTGPLATVLVYSDPAGNVMPPSAGPLRFVVADATSENAVMTGNQSVKMVEPAQRDASAATQIAVNAGDGQSATAGTAVATPPSVIVKDVHDNPVSGVSVTFAVAAGGGSATGTAATTNASGIATVGSWTLGAAAGANTLTATSGTLTGSPVTFTATGTAGILQVAVQRYAGEVVQPRRAPGSDRPSPATRVSARAPARSPAPRR